MLRLSTDSEGPARFKPVRGRGDATFEVSMAGFMSKRALADAGGDASAPLVNARAVATDTRRRRDAAGPAGETPALRRLNDVQRASRPSPGLRPALSPPERTGEMTDGTVPPFTAGITERWSLAG